MIFYRLGLPETIVSDNAKQSSSKESLNFYKIHSIVHLTSPPYHPTSNGMVERLIDIYKSAIRSQAELKLNEELQKFSSIYRITPNVNANSGIAQAKLMFVRKIRSVFDTLRPTEKKMLERKKYQW